jgi:predicted nucleic-acid-binding Zn-ribbon protein
MILAGMRRSRRASGEAFPKVARKQSESRARSFACVKCRGRACTEREVTIAALGHGVFRMPAPARYTAVTCALCGYTEFYSQAVVATDAESRPVGAELAKNVENP